MDDLCLDNIGQNSTYLLESRRDEQILLSSQKSIPGLIIFWWLVRLRCKFGDGDDQNIQFGDENDGNIQVGR